MSPEQPVSEVEYLIRQLLQALGIEVEEKDLKVPLRHAIRDVESKNWPSDVVAQRLLESLRRRRTKVEELIAAAEDTCGSLERIQDVAVPLIDQERLNAAKDRVKPLRAAIDGVKNLRLAGS